MPKGIVNAQRRLSQGTTNACTYRLAVAGRATAPQGCVLLVHRRDVDHADDRLPQMQEADRNAPVRTAAGEITRSVYRINHPESPQGFRAGFSISFLGEEGIVRKQTRQALHDEALDRQIGRGNDILRALGGDLQSLRLSQEAARKPASLGCD